MSDALTREQVETYTLSMERGRRDELLIHDATLRQRCEVGEQQWRKTNEQYEQAAKAVTRLTTQLAAVTQERDLQKRINAGMIADECEVEQVLIEAGFKECDPQGDYKGLLPLLKELVQHLTDAQATTARLRVGDRVIVYNRYLFAVPVVGVITAVSRYDNSLKIDFDEGQPGLHNVTKHNGGYFFREECRKQALASAEGKEDG